MSLWIEFTAPVHSIPKNFREILSSLVSEEEHVEWDYRKERFMAERRSLVGSILLSADPLEQVSEQARSEALLGVVRKKGLELLPWSKNMQQWRARIMLLHRTAGESTSNPWPDLSDEALLRDAGVMAVTLSWPGETY